MSTSRRRAASFFPMTDQSRAAVDRTPRPRARSWLRGERLAPWVLLAPALAILVPFFILPLAVLLRNSFNRDDPTALMVSDTTLQNYLRIVTDWYYATLFLNSIGTAIIVALITLVVGYPFAYYLVRYARRSRNLLLWILYTPIIVSVITRVFGWMVITADSGMINAALLWTGIIDQPALILFDVSGMMIGLVHRYLPLMILPLVNSLAKIDPRLLHASTTLGAGPAHTFFRVVLPLSLPGIVAGLQLSLAVVLSDFVLPTLLGSKRFRLLAPAIFDESIGNVRWAMAASMSITMLIVVGLAMLAMTMTFRRLAPWARGL